MVYMIFKGIREKSGKRRKKCYQHYIVTPTLSHIISKERDHHDDSNDTTKIDV